MGVVPMINLSRSLAIFCSMYWGVLGRVLWLYRVTFDVDHLFVVVYGCDNVSRKLSYLMLQGVIGCLRVCLRL